MAVHWAGWSWSVKATSVGGLSWMLAFHKIAHVCRALSRWLPSLMALSWLSPLSISRTGVTPASALPRNGLSACRLPLFTGQSPTHVPDSVHFSDMGKGLAESEWGSFQKLLASPCSYWPMHRLLCLLTSTSCHATTPQSQGISAGLSCLSCGQ